MLLIIINLKLINIKNNMSKKILALDTTSRSCSVALLYNNNIDHIFKKCKQNHEQEILPMIKHILLKHAIKVNQLNIIAFSKGPGSFTGIRIAIGIAKGLSFVSKIPIIGVSSLNIIAEKLWRKKKITHIITALYANRKKIYWSQYVRNRQNYWILQDLEAIIKIQDISLKLNKLKGEWTIVGNCYSIRKYINKTNENLILKFFYTKYSHARDIIPCVISILKNKLVTITNAPNYLD